MRCGGVRSESSLNGLWKIFFRKEITVFPASGGRRQEEKQEQPTILLRQRVGGKFHKD